MAQARPVANTLYVERPRLLRTLPDAPGFVVWLEAPYGYGKTVLASQWARELEADGWRIVWISAQDGDIQTNLNHALDLPGDAPWSLLLGGLWSDQTLVVLEDLTGDEQIRPLLNGDRGLVLLASRGTLGYPVLPKLVTAGKLHHLTGEALAFTAAEAELLFTAADEAQQAWEETQGWPLPLHFSAINVLPLEAATEYTEALRDTGIVQSLAAGYRLHPLIADGILTTWPSEVRQAVRGFQERLDIVDRGHAFARAKDTAGLQAVLSNLDERA